MMRALPLLLALFITLPSNHALGAWPLKDSQGVELPSLAPMLESVNPAVVNIATYSQRRESNPLLSDPFFRRFFNLPPQEYGAPRKQQNSAGSGVIVDADEGIVMTNFHVIKGADEVEVALIDGRAFKAKVLGSDPELDVAILKVDADQLSQIPLADSSSLRVGDFVVAIGNPFGLGQTVTTGIVSALGRTGLGIEGYENFIQTDASINPGNSGGALVNLRGELVGINTAIIAPSGGNVGIGFAIPINMARASLEQILDSGKVERGQLGVGIQEITPDLREAFNLDNGQQGVLISGVSKGSAADEAGIEPGDVVVSVNGEATLSTGQLRSQVGMHRIGDTLTLGIIRDRREREIRVKVSKPDSLSRLSPTLHRLLEGVGFENAPDGRGLVVTQVAPDTPAAFSGLRPGDRIVGANRQAVKDLESLQRALALNPKAILFHIERKGQRFYLVLQ
ncbi:DegQ family serine endoprotease [Aestuariirhabdus litorea]|uniref:DegQ family serine endoprotease n=1 Tax=Aestuariirhabdus litorea TaxID=2528527 RepID=A0A3P3VMB1_9GAMM|nr:DegQ family serine endoprotease [Aestuariirhabdus litorea]RRJ83770.1 DegQ family serine endoprotease [Aestuariirhabdus litorea]RWW96993.1 Do family serine endopeptidase [Endozoicomonadaceae bacterium GTF-13]